VPARNDKAYDTGQDHLVIGKVLAKVPVTANYLTQTKLNVNTFTADLAVQPGDSSSPVVALQGNQQVLTRLASATMYPTAMFTHVVRIDPLAALAEALRLATSGQTQSLQVRSPAATNLEQR
jgi:S1-C subfamily serine protease